MEGTGQEEEVESSDTIDRACVFPLSWNGWWERGNGRWGVFRHDLQGLCFSVIMGPVAGYWVGFRITEMQAAGIWRKIR